MKKFVFALAIVSTIGPAMAQGSWTCSAPGIQGFRYDGGSTAYIHLAPYQRGGDYAVTLNAAKSEARGKTANGTSFVCKRG